MYKLLKDAEGNDRQDCILKGYTFVPADEANADWREYQAWLALGNQPLEADE